MLVCSVFAAMAFLAAGTEPPASFRHDAMGTEFEIKLYAPAGVEFESRQMADHAFAEVDALENRISVWKPDSEVSRINQEAAARPMQVSGVVMDLMLYCKRIFERTGGAFDPTVGPLLEIWGLYRKQGRIPPEPEISSALERVGLDKVIIDNREKTVTFTRDYMRLDFGGIGKGLALDLAADVLRRHGVTAALLVAGTSSVLAIGAPPGEGGWTVRIRDPRDTRAPLEEITLKDASLSTSGSYERYFEIDGKHYAHIIDPRTGRPAQGLLSATAIAPTAIATDALSTAFFVMGIEKTAEYCRRHPGIQAILLPPGEKKAIRLGFSKGT